MTAGAGRPGRCWPRPAGPGRWRVCPTVEIASPADVLRRGRGGVRAAAGVERRALPGVPPRHLHLAGPDQTGQPAQRTPAAGGRAVGHGGVPAARGGVPVRGARAVLAHRPAAAVPRHPAGLLDRLGLPRRRARVRRGRAGARGGHRAAPVARWPDAGSTPADLQRRTVRRGRRPGVGRRDAGRAHRRDARRLARGDRAGERPGPGGRRRSRVAHLGVRPRGGPGGAAGRGGGRTCCSCTGTPRPSGTPGTSTTTTGARWST